MKEHATKTPAAGAIPPKGCVVYEVKTVRLDDDGKETGGAVYFEVCDDITCLPIAADLDMVAAITRAEAILNPPQPDDTLGKEMSSTATKAHRRQI